MKNKIAVKDISLAELKDRITDETHQLEKLRFSHAVSAIENPMKLRHNRRQIARLKTELRHRELQNAAK